MSAVPNTSNKIVLVMPNDGFWTDLSNGVHLPGALLAIATLPDKDGFDVKIIDQRIDPQWKENLVKELQDKPLFVGITSMTGSQITPALKISAIVKENNCLCVWGGVHASLLPEQTLKNPLIDIIVKGEGEITTLELAKALRDKKSLLSVNGLYYKNKFNDVVKTDDRDFVDLNELPDYPYHLINVKDYLYTFEGKKFLNVFSSRGCPFQCRFCYNTVFNKRLWRSIKAETVIKRIARLKKEFGIEGAWFRDDNFFVDIKNAEKIIKGLTELGLCWGTSGARLDLFARFDEDMIKTINKSNCKFLFMGIESGSNKILDLIGKQITREKIIDVNKKILSRINAVQRMNFMIGLPKETIQDLKDTISLSYQILKDNKNAIISQYQIYTPYPGTMLYTYSLENGFVEPRTLEEWSNYRFEVSNIPSIKQDHKNILRMLAFTTWFMDDKIQIYSKSKMIKVLAKFYKPIARYRIKKLNASFPIDIKVAERIGF